MSGSYYQNHKGSLSLGIHLPSEIHLHHHIHVETPEPDVDLLEVAQAALEHLQCCISGQAAVANATLMGDLRAAIAKAGGRTSDT